MKNVGHVVSTLNYLALAVLLLTSILSFFGSTHFLLDLLSHFHFQYTVGFLVLVGFFLLQKKPLLVFVATIGFITQTIYLLPYYFQPKASATIQAEHSTVRVYFNNINYGTTDFSSLVNSVTQYKPQIIGVAELSAEKFILLKNQLPSFPYVYHVPGRGKLGLAIFSQLPFSDQPSTQYFSDHLFPSLVATVQDPDTFKQLKIIVIHPPPPITGEYTSARNTLFDNLAEYSKSQTNPLLVMGDFNSTGWSPAFQQLLSNSGLIDSRNNQGTQPSWPSQLPKLLRIPIDHILTNEALLVSYREILPSVGSDHLPVLVDVLW